MNDFKSMRSPWCLVYVIATNADGNKEPHILSCHRRDQTGHCYIIKSAAWEFLMFRCWDLAHLTNNLFMKQGRLNLVSKLREYRSFANISPDYVNGENENLDIMPKIWPCEEYSTMEVSIISTHFSNFPMVNPTSELIDTQPFAVSFINADDGIVVDF